MVQHNNQQIDLENSIFRDFISVNGAYSFIDQYFYLKLPEEVIDRLSGNEDYNDFADSLLYTKLGHERAHYLQNIGTSYGMWKSLCLRVAGMWLSQALCVRAQKGLPIHNYLYDSMPRSVPPRSEKSISLYCYANRLFGWIRCMEHGFLHDAGPFLNIPGARPPSDRTNPMWETPEGTTPPITGDHLLEFQAKLLEIESLAALREVPLEHKKVIIQQILDSMQFRLPLTLIRIAFKNSAFTDSQTLFSDDSKLFCFELCDFALNPPLDFNFLSDIVRSTSVHFRRDLLDWEEIHPGWRFVRVLRYVHENNVAPPRPKDIKRFIDDIADKLGFLRREDNRVAPEEIKAESRIIMKDLLGPPRGLFLSLLQNDAPAWLAYFSMLHARGCDGPLRRNKVGLDSWSIGDVAFQVYYSNEIVCPHCVATKHHADCSMLSYLGELGLE